MKTRIRLATVVGAGVLLLAGCKPAPAPDATTSPQDSAAATAPAAPAPAPAEFGETMLQLNTLATCGDKQVSTIRWTKEAVAKGPASIELGDVDPGVFARIGEEGEKETGDWAYPGGVVVLRGDDGVVRARQMFKGPGGCTTVAAEPQPAPESNAATDPATPPAAADTDG